MCLKHLAQGLACSEYTRNGGRGSGGDYCAEAQVRGVYHFSSIDIAAAFRTFLL